MRATSPRRAPSDSCTRREALRNMGLIRGACEENAIVLTRDGIKNGPLRFPDEFVRHKVLDLIGDLSLIGHQVLGRVVADRAGHAMHTALVSRLLRDHLLVGAGNAGRAGGDARDGQRLMAYVVARRTVLRGSGVAG